MAKVFGIAVDLNNRDHFAETIGDISWIGSSGTSIDGGLSNKVFEAS